MIIFYFPFVLFLSFFWGVLIAVIGYRKKHNFPKSKLFFVVFFLLCFLMCTSFVFAFL